MEASELKMRLDEALSVHRQAAARENEQQGYWQVHVIGARVGRGEMGRGSDLERF